MDKYKANEYQMPITLEEHLKSYSDEGIENLYNTWKSIKKRLVEQLEYSKNIFVNYSLHNATHSKSVIQGIERFLGADRIRMLSPTDTFMILVCSFAHDYGMALTYDRVYEILGSSDFETFIETLYGKLYNLDDSDRFAVSTLYNYLHENKEKIPLKDMYYSIMLMMQAYIRPKHSANVIDFSKDFQEIFKDNIIKRFVVGTEGIVNVCMCHGMTIDEVLQLSFKANGILDDHFHPRFVASMLRLGDLLDLDNGRFPRWFVDEVNKDSSLIPKMSKIHFFKHESITHYLISPKRIEITANCLVNEKDDPEYEMANRIANCVSEWITLLENECNNLVLHWNDIAPFEYGRPPGKIHKEILLNGQNYSSKGQHYQMQMSQERVMALLEGTSIYQNKYVGIREILQNAIDASLLQLWNDIMNNRYITYGLSKDSIKGPDNKGNLQFKDLLENNRSEIFNNYDITIEVIKDIQKSKVFVVVKDKGIGITTDEVKFIANIGSGREENNRVKKIRDNMPEWLRPSGIFGIGLQSVFQLTNCIEFYSRQPNTLENVIRLHSIGMNKGTVDSYSLVQKEEGLYADNANPGTNVKIEILPEKLKDSNDNFSFQYYDASFDHGDELDMIFKEVCSACAHIILESRYDYFNVNFCLTTILSSGEKPNKEIQEEKRTSFFRKRMRPSIENHSFGYVFESFRKNKKNIKEDINSNGDLYAFNTVRALFWDNTKKRKYLLKLRPCMLKDPRVFLPESKSNLYTISYKFNTISDLKVLYHKERLHAGFAEMDVQIFGGTADEYFNIDRDRLKKNSIDESELNRIRKDMVIKWFAWYMEETNVTVNGKWLSLALLFYQYIPEDKFIEFIEKYRNQINDYALGNEDLKFECLWKSEKGYVSWSKNGINQETDYHSGHTFLPITIIKRLSHRVVFIDEIEIKTNHNPQFDYQIYYFNLKGGGEDETTGIKMDDIARLDDYKMMMDLDSSKNHKADFRKMIRKLFKPDKAFEGIIVNQYPHTFHKGNNLSRELDYLIERFILSPFCKETTILLLKLLKGIIKEEEFYKKMFESERFKDCINYVSEINNTDIKTVTGVYGKFVRKVTEVLEKNKTALGYDNNNYVNSEEMSPASTNRVIKNVNPKAFHSPSVLNVQQECVRVLKNKSLLHRPKSNTKSHKNET